MVNKALEEIKYLGLHISLKSFGERNSKWPTFKSGRLIALWVKKKVIMPNNKTIASCAWKCFGYGLWDLVLLVGYNGCAWSSSSHWKGVERFSNDSEFQFWEHFLSICRWWDLQSITVNVYFMWFLRLYLGYVNHLMCLSVVSKASAKYSLTVLPTTELHFLLLSFPLSFYFQ